jgi:uncharacterized CHY-type Zn-finger protein
MEAKLGVTQVVLVRCDDTCLTFMNSWGASFCNNGFLTIDKHTTLNDESGESMQFFDVFWTTNDLSTKEIEAWKEDNTLAVHGLMKTLPTSFHDLPVSCPLCRSSAPAKDYTGSWDKARCCKCNHVFKPTVQELVRSLYHNNYNFV